MRLAIGTAQFGLHYGLANAHGRVPVQEATQIIHTARKAGVDTIDTAIAYGDSEDILGNLGMSGWNVISKIPAIPETCEDAGAWMMQQARGSLNRLGIKQLAGLLMHKAEDLLGTRRDEVLKTLNEIKDIGLARMVGISIYSPDLLPELLNVHKPDMIQAPLNVFDQRLVKSCWLDRLSSQDIAVHARSAFLQGLLLMEPGKVPRYFDPWKNELQRWHNFVAANGRDPQAICLGFVKSQPGISRIVVGVDSKAQLDQLITAYPKTAVSGTSGFASLDASLVEPMNWKI